jgi:hypothetical protein
MNNHTNFTKGPWLKESEQVTGGYLVKPEGWSRGVCTVTQRDAHPINGMGITWDEASANASLISCAPEMYYLLNKLQIEGGLGIARHREIERLLAKARGEK